MTTTENLVHELTIQYGRERNSLMPILQTIVREEKYLSEEAMVCVAKELHLSTADVFGTASFYSFLDIQPRGKHIIRICKTISCHMQGKEEIIRGLEDLLNIKVGETTHDNKFSLLTTNCLGWCHKGPVMLVNDDVHSGLSLDSAIEIIEEYARNGS